MPLISSLPPIMVCGVGGRLVPLVSLGYVVQNTLLAHASSMPPFLSLPLTMACDDGDRCDDDNLQQLCFVTHGLWTPVSWLGSRSSIAVAAMVIVPRDPTLLADLRVVYTNVNFTYDWREFQVRAKITNVPRFKKFIARRLSSYEFRSRRSYTLDPPNFPPYGYNECRPVFGTKGLFQPPDLPEAVHKSPQFGRAARVRTSTQSDSTQPQLSNLVPRNAKTGISKGCGYVTMSSLDEAKAEIAALDGSGAKLGTSSAMWTTFPGPVKHSVQPDLGCQRL
ncbi:28 kDa ribonucleoprotein, chloroplastic [Tanacetum coccineum]